MNNKIKIGKKIIGIGERTFIIAEAGINHNGDIETAKRMIVEAKKAGADAIKFQTYTTDKRVPKNSPIYEILKKCELTNSETKILSDFSRVNKIIFFSTPFDEECVDFLIKINTPLLKIASFDIVNHKLLDKAAKTKTPIILSRGMANTNEIDQAIRIFKKYNTPFALLHCVSSYPTNEENANLSIIRTLIKNYDCPVGYSDHTLGIDVPALSVAVGGCIIEKHFTLDKKMNGPDHKLSCNPEELKELVSRVRTIEKILGTSEIRMLKCEQDTTQFRRPS